MKHATAAVAAVWALAISIGSASSQPLLPGERETNVTGIAGVVSPGAKWEIVWADFETADGINGTPDGGVIFAQEQTDTIRKLTADGKEYTVVNPTRGVGSVSLDAQGRLYAVERTCTEPLNTFLPGCNDLTAVVQLLPERRVLAMSFANGAPLGRLNDLIADGKGGAYFTVGGAYYVNPSGVVSTVAEGDIRSNGIMLSPDGRTLYVTNNMNVLAFDVRADGTTSNRRDFGALDGDDGGDGMAVDSEGRVYVTGNRGVHVLSTRGEHLGLIPTPRRPISVAFSGPDKKVLYAPMSGAVGPDGKAWTTPETIRNTAMTIYRITMLSQGYEGRPK
ncbi:MAG TPA: SMP-30/gluconolactonase/LRE family protein [Gammaproteobacteria bacterium]|nr:SMP-30/gluconolactonase/LRE family protein [Gammaproteobacteria bacterium]